MTILGAISTSVATAFHKGLTKSYFIITNESISRGILVTLILILQKFLLPFFFCIEIVTILIADITKSAESDEASTSEENDDDSAPEESSDQPETISKDEL